MKAMKMRFDHTAPLWHRLWSVRLALLAALVSVAGQVLPLWQPLLAPFPFAILNTVLALLAAVSRVIHQGEVRDDLARRRGAGGEDGVG